MSQLPVGDVCAYPTICRSKPSTTNDANLFIDYKITTFGTDGLLVGRLNIKELSK